MHAKVGTAVLVSLALAMSACGSNKDEATVTLSPTLQVTPAPPFGSQTTQAGTISATNVPIPSTTYKSESGLLTDLTINRAKWDAAGILNYQYQVKIHCFCGEEGLPLTTMIVRDGQSTSIANSDGPIVPMGRWYDTFNPYSTVDRTFQQLETDIREASGVVVTYDEEYGFPTEISVAARGFFSDSGSLVTISGFEVLP